MFKYTTTTLKKIEQLFKEGGYIIRYERGNFHAGYCILEKKKVVVVNKFYDLEARINCLIDILVNVDLDVEQITPETMAHMAIFQSEIDQRRADMELKSDKEPASADEAIELNETVDETADAAEATLETT